MNKNKSTMRLMQLLDALATGKVDPARLTARIRKKIVQYFMEERSEATNRYVAKLIGVSDTQVCRIRRQLVRRSSWQIEDMDVKELATELKIRKTELQRRAIGSRDYGLAWKIECDFIDKMADLGFLKLPPKRVAVAHFYPQQLEQQLEEFFNEFGVPNAEAFLAQLRDIAGGDGRNPAGLLVAPVESASPAGGDSQPAPEGIED